MQTKNKKGLSTMGVIASAILVLAVTFVILYSSTGFLKKENKLVDGTICDTGDADNDGIVDAIDSCVCDDEDICKSGTITEKKSCKQRLQANC